MQAPFEQTVQLFGLSIIYFLIVIIDPILKPIKLTNIGTSGVNILSKSSNILVLQVLIYQKLYKKNFLIYFLSAKRP